MRVAICFLLLLFAFSITSCKEEYKNINPYIFNKKIRSNNKIKTPTDLIIAYDTTLAHGYDGRLLVTRKKLEGDKLEITAIITINDDDEIKAEKYLMVVEHSGTAWNVLEIQHNWKCYEGYGHTDWGI